MSLVIPMDGAASMLALIVNKLGRPGEDLVLQLYRNDYAPTDETSVEDLTEMAGSGYEAITMPGAEWSVVEGRPSYAQSATVVFTFSGAAGQAFGYYVTHETSGALMWAERFPEPYPIRNDGDQIKVTPRLEFRSRR